MVGRCRPSTCPSTRWPTTPAAAIANIAHRTQVDKIGYDYIDHLARVAEAFNWLEQPRHHCAAWLHDFIEDSDISAHDLLAAGVLPEIVKIVELLTRPAEASPSRRGHAAGHPQVTA